MRSPESRAGHRAGRTFEEELSLRYLSPGAFTILSAEDHGIPPDPPTAPLPYRLAPTNVRHKNQSFSILAEFNPPLEASRSPSPTSGRISPFRGRGFNPVGSRHASPTAGSPPPPVEDVRYASEEKLNRNRSSQIPQLQRKDSMSQSVDDSDDQQPEGRSPKFRRKYGGGGSTQLNSNMSQSLTNVNGGGGGHEKQGLQRGGGRPPISPRKYPGIHGKGAAAAFSKLSPIIGSSPEPCPPEPKFPSSSTASSKIPRSRSQPHSRRQSPNRAQSPESKRHNSRAGQRPQQGGSTFRVSGSRNASRDASPGTSPTSPTRIPVRSHSYKNVQARVNTGSVNRTPRPAKQEEKEKPKERISRNESYRNRSLHRNSNNNSIGKTFNRNSNNNNSSGAGSNKNINKISEEKSADSNGNAANNKSSSVKGMENKSRATNPNEKIAKSKTDNSSSKDTNGNSSSNVSEKNAPSNKNPIKSTSQQVQPGSVKKVQSVPRLIDMLPSAETVVTTTTTAVTKPLKIEAKLDTAKLLKTDQATAKSPKETPMYMDESRVLSATSVSSAINRMNDTVLDSHTLMKDHNLSKLSPAASAIISMSNNEAANAMGNAVPVVENVKTQMANNVAVLETTVKSNIGKLISPDDTFGARVSHVSSNERVMKEPRTVVKVVAEKPMNADVQSGNVRLPNGISSERPGLPPPQPPVNNANVHQPPVGRAADTTKTNCCTKYFKCCLPKLKGTPPAGATVAAALGDQPKRDWFSCCRKGGNKKEKDMEEAIVSTSTTATTAAVGTSAATKSKWYERLKCWNPKGNKVGDGDTSTSCCPMGKRKLSWVNRRDSILSDLPATGSFCKRIWKKIFCLDSQCCKKKAPIVPQDSVSRRTSLISKKKSLTPTVLPQDDPKDKIDASLVEHTSTMKGAIPVLPVGLAWFCLVMNCIVPGTGTVFSGLFCLCMGKPRFSQKDGAKPRIGAFIIDLIIGFGQAFTVLFCLVGWGWSIWWGVIMLKTARKHRKIKLIEAAEEARQGAAALAAAIAPAAVGGKQPGQAAATTHRNNQRDVERGS